MTAKELLKDLDTCTGPCGNLCLSCPESRYLPEIREVLVRLMEENEKLRRTLMAKTGEVDFI
jgi:hypothetical protein